MAKGICIFAENYNGKLEPASAELVTAARILQETTKEEISAVIAGNDCDGTIQELKNIGIDRIYVVKTERNLFLQDEAASQMYAEMLRKIEPSAVLIPATPTGRSVFSRVAMKLECGMTADCTELLVGTREDGSYYIKQNKPSFGENVFVTILTREGIYPQMMTVRPGVYTAPETREMNTEIVYMDEVDVPDSRIQVVEKLEAQNNADSILSSEIVVVGGRGVLEEESFTLVKEFAPRV